MSGYDGPAHPAAARHPRRVRRKASRAAQAGAMTTGAAPLAGADSGRRPALFGRLLILLVFTYLLSAFTDSDLVNALQVVLFLGVVLLSLRTGRLHRRTVRIAAIGLVIGSVVAVALQRADHNGPGAAVANMWTALVLILSVVFIVRRVLSQPDITLQSIYGAISAYMILGLMFAAVYAAMYHFGGNTFFAHDGHLGSTKTFQYFSFTTLTTLGYGDYTAAQSPGQAVAVIEAMVGQIFLATLVARLVAGYRGAARAAARPHPAGGHHGAGAPGAAPEGEPAGSGTAGGRRARSRRAGAPGLTRLRPPGAVRSRAVTGIRPPSSPGRASRERR
jgi:Ion channel